ncbi:ATP-binding protein [Hansschlegelia beijingensis]|uniref:histidine kinase n=1 Tax=Hansschlegelia beijingensis TaxID=1133344 RepID=A0A7W6GF25_9HYPH|nr:signal transduction histidine kinase [Hansschlegelia beijingensis]
MAEAASGATERADAAALSELRAGLEAVPAGVAIWSADRALSYANQRFRRTFEFPIAAGVSFDAFVGDLVASREWLLPGAPEEWERAERADFGRDKQGDYVLADGRVMNLSQAPSEGGGMVQTLTDVTSVKRNEGALREAKEAAEATDEAKSRFLRAANHDLRQPLASLKILIYNCMREADETHRAEMLHAMSVAVLIMEDLLGALLQIGQLDAGRIQPRVTSFQLSQIFERLDIQFRHQAQEKGLRLKFVTPRGTVATDRALLERILSNFVANAIRFTEVGTVLVGCRKEGRLLRIEVVDTGRGVRDEDRERVFEEFYRAAEERRGQKSGLGLGLNIVKRLADLLELPVRLRSQVGRGSIFSVTVPLGNIWHSEGGEIEISEMVGGEFAGTPVLLVEDDDILRRSMTQLLQRWGIEVHAAADEAEALELGRSGVAISLIIADYNLKSRTGIDVVRALRQQFGVETPAMIVTADAEPRVLESIREEGLPVLIKPVSPPRLRVLMHNLLFEPGLIFGSRQ